MPLTALVGILFSAGGVYEDSAGLERQPDCPENRRS